MLALKFVREEFELGEWGVNTYMRAGECAGQLQGQRLQMPFAVARAKAPVEKRGRLTVENSDPHLDGMQGGGAGSEHDRLYEKLTKELLDMRESLKVKAGLKGSSEQLSVLHKWPTADCRHCFLLQTVATPRCLLTLHTDAPRLHLPICSFHGVCEQHGQSTRSHNANFEGGAAPGALPHCQPAALLVSWSDFFAHFPILSAASWKMPWSCRRGRHSMRRCHSHAGEGVRHTQDGPVRPRNLRQGF